MPKKVVIITGASSGIGKALAFEMAERDYSVVIAARNALDLENIKNILTAKGADVLCVAADVSVEADCKRIIDSALNSFGKIDVMVNNAGISMRAFFHELDLSVIHNLMNTNFWGTVYCTKYALPELIKTKGSVVAVSSIAGYIPLPGRSGYSASKSAIHAFMNTIRVENVNNRLHVMIAAPGYTTSNIRKNALLADGSVQHETPRDENKMMTSEKVAWHIANGIQKRKRTVTLTTEGKLSVFLYKFFPGLVDKIVLKKIKKEPDFPNYK